MGEYSHKHAIPYAVLEVIKHVLRDLSNLEIAKKKSVHGKIRTRVSIMLYGLVFPKTLLCY